jgi:hypothetical protein
MRRHPGVSNWCATPYFHPDFGYLCPSRDLRRRARAAMCYLVVVVLAGATVATAITHRAPRDEEPNDGVWAAGSIEQSRLSPIEAVFEPPTPSTPQVSGSCKDLATASLSSPCSSGKIRAKHIARAPSRLATLIVGHANASADSTGSQAPAEMPSEPTESTILTANAGTSSTVKPLEQSRMHAKKRFGEKREKRPAGNDGSIDRHDDRNRVPEIAPRSYAANQTTSFTAPKAAGRGRSSELRPHIRLSTAQGVSVESWITRANFQGVPKPAPARAYLSFGMSGSHPAFSPVSQRR